MTISEFKNQYGIISKSKEINDLVDITMQVAKSDISVLLFGESGVGKEVFTRALHEYSDRGNKKLVSVNCGAIPEGILESELFGHKKGSFTGAMDDRKGYFEIADGGTLFLDEIAEMPLTTQVKLLRVLETKEFMKIGSETVTKVDVRILAAANKDLQKEVDVKRFRNDLYFRLKAVTLNIPPLRDRVEDIGILADYFLELYAKKNNIDIPRITQNAYALMYQYKWPGNIRELKNVIETASALSRTGIIEHDSIIPLLSSSVGLDENRNLPIHLNKSPEALDREMIYRALIEIKKDLLDLKQLAFKNQNEMQTYNNGSMEVEDVIPMDDMERRAIINALNYTKQNKRKAARLLNISERTLYRKINEYGL
ncbi:MAG: sigma-54-dependent Fis family transcriptional regulator [Melioribacteraceae bacterium]|nr:sigma-54-dependent Fis family transcriptional regulator [Melioribacteraceae bacterium]